MGKRRLLTLPIVLFTCLSGMTLTGCFDNVDPNPSGNVNNRIKSLTWSMGDEVTIYLDEDYNLNDKYVIEVEGEVNREVKFLNSRPNTIRLVDGICHPLKAGYSDITVYSVFNPAIRDKFKLIVEERPVDPAINSISFLEESHDLPIAKFNTVEHDEHDKPVSPIVIFEDETGTEVEVSTEYVYNLDADLTINSQGGASKKVTYTSSNKNLISLKSFYDPEFDYYFIGALALQEGSATVTVTSNFDNTKTDSMQINGLTPRVTGIHFHHYDVYSTVGLTIDMRDYIVFDKIFNPTDLELYFTTEDPTIGEVDGNYVHCLDEGEIYINAYYVSDPTINDECILHITYESKVNSITVSQNELTYTMADKYFGISSLITVDYEGDIELVPALAEYICSVETEEVIKLKGTSGAVFDIVAPGTAVITITSVFAPSVTATITVTITA